WYLERILWLIAGSVVLTGTILGIVVHPYWFALPILVGINLLIFAFSGFCPMAVLLHKMGVKSITETRGVRN
ncbi:MAG: YgaP family membrane protein, partial [Dissulfurimicrobium sp.]